MLEERLANLVCEYLKQHKEIDFDFINEVVMIAKEYYGLEDYISKVINCNINKYTIAAYATLSHEIFVAVKDIENYSSCIEENLNFLNRTRVSNYINCIYILLHEVEHANQQKKIDEINENNDIEGIILSDAYSPLYKSNKNNIIKRIKEVRKYQKLVRKYYEFSPVERLAQIYSLETTGNLARLLEDDLSCDLMKYKKLESLLEGYNIGLINFLSSEPTKFYLNKINPDNNYKKIDLLSKSLSFEDKMKFGLKTSNDTLHQTSEQSKKMLKEMILKY